MYDDKFIEKHLPKITEARCIAISKILDYEFTIDRLRIYDMIEILNILIYRVVPDDSRDFHTEQAYLKVLSFHLKFDATKLPEEFWKNYFEYLDVSSRKSNFHSNYGIWDDWMVKCKTLEQIFDILYQSNSINFLRKTSLDFLLQSKFENEELAHMFFQVLTLIRSNEFNLKLDLNNKLESIGFTERTLISKKLKEFSIDALYEFQLDCFMALAQNSFCTQNDIKKVTNQLWEFMYEENHKKYPYFQNSENIRLVIATSTFSELLRIENSLVVTYIYKCIECINGFFSEPPII